MITEIKQSFDELKKDESVFQTQQQDALHTMKKQFKQVKQTISDQMAEMSSNVDKELSILKKTTDSIKEESQGVISSLNQSAEQKLNEKTSYLQKMFDDARKQLQGDLESAKSEQSAKDEELRSGIADIDNILKTAYRPQIKAIMKDVAAFRDEVQQQNGKFKSDIGKIRSKADQITNMGSLIEGVQQESEKAIQEFSKRMKTEFLDTKKTVDSVLNKASTDVSELRASIETIMRELMSLKHIHHLNAEFEQFQHRFEEALAFLQQVQRTMCNFVFPGSKELPAVNAKDTIDDKQVSRMKRQKPPTLKGQQVYELDISSLEADDDLGIPIRSALLTHSCVSVTIPPKTQVTWNKSVALLPNQSLIVKGSRGSVIVMDGSSSLGELTDASRVTLDGFCILQVTNVKVQARCFAKSAKAMLDLNALFVARSWDAAGINTIQIDSCEFETDVPVVNIGANAVTHVTITDSRIVSKTKGKTIINPVTAESGGYNHGYGSLTTTNVRITRPNVEWLESPYLSHATSTSNDL